MKDKNLKEKPEVYALRQDDGNWHISRRDFLKAAGAGAAAFGAGLNSGCSRTKDLEKLCPEVPSTVGSILTLISSYDGKYLLSSDHGMTDHAAKQNKKSTSHGGVIRCWDFEKHYLTGSGSAVNGHWYAAGPIEGKPSYVYNEGGSAFYCFDLPIKDGDKAVRISLPGSGWFQIDSRENIYTISGKEIYYHTKESNYKQSDLLYEIPEGITGVINNIHLFNNEKSLFVIFETNPDEEKKKMFGVLDPEKKEMKIFDEEYEDFALFPYENKALICNDNEYRMISFDDGSTAWSKTIAEELKSKKEESIRAAVVAPDGAAGFLLIKNLYKNSLYMISMADGSLIEKIYLGEGKFAGPVINKDGTQLAVSVKNTLLFFSLPDLKLISCPVDMSILPNKSKGVRITAKDSGTGEEYEFTMPCGSAIPEGAVCTCNCVSGSACSCYGHKSSGGSGGSHYWHPN